MKIREIINDIDQCHLFIPAFQREYVWKRNDAKNLISSLIKDYPTGTLLTWKTTNPPELKGSYAYQATQGSVKLVLDGQQRITTLYMLITGKIPPYYEEKHITNHIMGLYVNVETLELEYYKKITMANNPAWVDITKIFADETRIWDVVEKIGKKEDIERLPEARQIKIDDNIRAIRLIHDRNFAEQEVPVTATLKEAIDIFYIVNASGVNLTDAELALAQISGYWPRARKEIMYKLDKLKANGWVFNLDFMMYVLLAIVHQQGSKMEKLHTPGNKEKLKETWSLLRDKVLDYTCNILQNHAYIDHTNEINSVYALIPIITYIYKKPNNQLSENEIKKIIKWFYYSQIRVRYISQLPQKLDKDISIIVHSSSPFDELLKLIEEERPLNIKASEFIGRGIQHPLFSLMRWYFKSVRAVCLCTGLSLKKNMGAKYELERDHIFAYSVLRDSEYFDMDNRFDYSLAQEITNRVILTQTCNRDKSAKLANIFLETVIDKFPNALKAQCIPEDRSLWQIENYKEFLETRRKLLADKLNDFLNNISITPKRVVSDIDIDAIIYSGETEEIEFKSSLRWNTRESKVDKKMEFIILKSIAAFSNGDGGRLLIGVADNGEILGIQDDLNTLKEANKDHFELHLRNIINSTFGKNFAISNIKVKFYKVSEQDICVIDIGTGNRPLYLEVTEKNGQKNKKFYVRSGNSSPEFDLEETASYVQNRF